MRARKPEGRGAAAEPEPVRAAMCKLYRLEPAGSAGMLRAPNMQREHETRLVHVHSIDTKYVVARPLNEPRSAYFLPYSHTSGLR